MGFKIEGLSDWVVEAWETRLSGKIVRVVDVANYSEGWDTDSLTVLELDNGNYVTAAENYCSCGDPSDADLDEFDTLEAAMESLNHYRKIKEPEANDLD